MEIVKKTDKYTVVKKRSGRYGVQDTKGEWINGVEKVKILLENALVKTAPLKLKEVAKKAEAAPAAEEKTE